MASTTPVSTMLVNGRIFKQGGAGWDGKPEFADSMFIQDGIIKDIGARDELSTKYQHESLQIQDLAGKTILPGFFDAHMHLLLLGQSLQKVTLDHCQSAEEIIETIRAFAQANPDLSRIQAAGWAMNLTPDGVHAKSLDEIDSRPIYVDAVDLHSVWCNSAAISEMGLTDMPDPEGGEIHRYEDGTPTGFLSENAVVSIVWPFLAQTLSKSERMQYMHSAFEAYSASGYTSAVEMAMDEVAWDALTTLFEEKPNIPIRMTVYWLIKPGTEDSIRQQVDRATELHRQFNRKDSPKLNVAGIKLICDGTIDACTAYLSEPYAIAPSAPPIWEDEKLIQAVQQASQAGLQIALHAIGDKAIKTAVDALEKYTTPGSRHRIEHLEFSRPEDAKRLGSLGITASIQPVHADPVVLVDWPRLIGTHRCSRAFAYKDFADGGALIAIGSDTPTAPWNPLRNLYVATTRRSARQPELTDTVNEHFRLGLCESITAATAGAAKSVFAEGKVGTLEIGKAADFIVLDFEWDAKQLLDASVEETWFNGKRVYQKRP